MRMALAILVTLAVAGASWFTLDFGGWTALAEKVGDCQTIQAMGREAQAKGDTDTAENLYEQATACRDERSEETKETEEPDAKESTPATAPTVTETVTASPTATPTATTTVVETETIVIGTAGPPGAGD